MNVTFFKSNYEELLIFAYEHWGFIHSSPMHGTLTVLMLALKYRTNSNNDQFAKST